MSKPLAVFMDFLERAGWTAGQVFLTVLLATGAAPSSVIDLPWQLALVMAGGAAVASVVSTALIYLTPLKDMGFWPDLVVRLAKTFLSSLAGSFGADYFNVLTFDWAGALDLAAIATVTALAKGLLSRQPQAAGDEPNPSSLPPETYRLAVKS